MAQRCHGTSLIQHKDYIVNYVVRTLAIPRKEAEAVIEAVFAAIMDSLRNGLPLEIRGFGRFGVRIRKAHTSRHPATGAPVAVPDRFYPTFRPGNLLKKSVTPS